MHIPVLKREIIELLNPKQNENFIDCTIGEGGHAREILEKIKPKGRLLGIDWDTEIIKKLKAQLSNLKFQDRLILINDSYVHLKEIVEKLNFSPVNGILLDLGMSSWHLEESGRGFSFLRDEPLNMRYNQKFSILNFPSSHQKSLITLPSRQFSNKELTAEEIVNNYSEKEIEKILKEYGEERFAKRIAKKIIEKRKIKPIKTTFQLIEIIKKAIPFRKKFRINPATRTFQALRIAVNDELNNLKKFLPQAVEILAPKGRLAIISFHSLEDRIVKNFFKDLSKKNKIKILVKKPVNPSKKEISQNPRARSAKLRVAEII